MADDMTDDAGRSPAESPVEGQTRAGEPSDGYPYAAPNSRPNFSYQPDRPPLLRSRTDRMVAGICGGLGRYWNIDPVLLRVVVGVLTLATGGLLLAAYALAWLLIRNEPEAAGGVGFAAGGAPPYANPLRRTAAGESEPRSPLGWVVLGLALALVGVMGLANALGASIPVVTIVGLCLALLGAGLVVGAFRGRARWLIAVAIPVLLIGAGASAMGSHMRFGHWDDGDGMRYDRDFRGQGWNDLETPTTWTVDQSTVYPVVFENGVGDSVLDLTGLLPDDSVSPEPTTSPSPTATSSSPSATTSGTPAATPSGIPAEDASASSPAQAEAKRIAVDMRAGNLFVRVPSDLAVELKVESKAGEVIVDGSIVSKGLNNSITMYLDALDSSRGTVRLDVEMGIGTVEVRREAA